MAAFAVDMGYITHTQNELQSAADAAALAGAGQLTSSFVSYYLPKQTSSQQQTILTNASSAAQTYAQKYAGYNSAGGVSSLQLPSSDIELGYTDASGKYTPCPTYTGYPNTVKVVLRRDNTANGPLGLFFAPVLGTNTINLTATASATIFAGVIDGAQTGTSINSRILPMTYDVNHWNSFLNTGQSPDGTTSTAPNGWPQLNVYPSTKFTGNFGELSLDQGNDGASTISNWINNGVPGADVQHDYTAGLLPLSQHNPLSAPDWKGNPGLKDSTIQTVGGNIGQTYLLPLFKPVDAGSPDPSTYQAGSGSGSNYYYTLVGFVGVTITAVDSTGGNKSISVQPSALIDPNAIYSSVTPAAPPTSTSPLSTTFTAPKLTR
jgi:hypothetical protein